MTRLAALKPFMQPLFERSCSTLFLHPKWIPGKNLQCAQISSQKLIFSEFGDPAKVVRLEHEELREPKENEVLVRMLAAPLNPADINTIQGVYPAKPPLPAVPGNEGAGEILSVGLTVEGLKPGDRVVALAASNWGTWRTHAICDAKAVWKVPQELGVVEAATMSVNPYTAYRMLKDFVPLSEGDVVIQNGANSACGQNVIQLCKEWGYRTVNVVRDRPNIDELKQYLTDLGATHVLTEEELRKTEIFKSGEVAKPKLALNCVGGRSSELILRQLSHGGVLVTYGGMSRVPTPAHTSLLIFKDVTLRGFWMTVWTQRHTGSPQHLEMKDYITQLLIDKKLRPPAHKLVPITAYKEAVDNALAATGFVGLKYVFDLQNNG